MVGKWPLVSEATKIPIDTLKKWKQADWWKDMEDELRRSSHLETSGKLSTIIKKAASVVEDRLENGDLIFNKDTNKFSRRPVGAKIASDILVKSIDRSILLDKIQEKPVFKEEAILDRLKNIEQALLRGAKKRVLNEKDIIDVSPVTRSIDIRNGDPLGSPSNELLQLEGITDSGGSDSRV